MTNCEVRIVIVQMRCVCLYIRAIELETYFYLCHLSAGYCLHRNLFVCLFVSSTTETVLGGLL